MRGITAQSRKDGSGMCQTNAMMEVIVAAGSSGYILHRYIATSLQLSQDPELRRSDAQTLRPIPPSRQQSSPVSGFRVGVAFASLDCGRVYERTSGAALKVSESLDTAHCFSETE